MSNKASTPANASPLTVKEAEQPDIVKKIGNTTYRVKIHFSTTSKETMSDKIKRLIMNDYVLTPKRISGREMLDTVCTMAQVGAEQVLVLADSQPMLELVQAVEHSAVAADAPAELRLAAGQVTLTDAAGGAAVEVLYRMVRAAEKSV